MHYRPNQTCALCDDCTGYREIPEPPDWRPETKEAIASVTEHADEEWKRVALDMVKRFAASGQEFMTHEVLIALEAQPVHTSDLRAIGGIMAHCMDIGLIEKTGEHRPNPNRHGSPAPVWRPRC